MNSMNKNSVPHILYMEDDESLAWLVAKKLRRHGFKVDLAGDGSLGLEMINAGSYNIVLLDYKMPEKNGLEVLQILLADPANPPAIMVSGTANLETAVEAMRLGAADYVIKENGESYLDLLMVTINRVMEKHRLLLEKELAEAELKKSQEQYQRILETANFIPWEFDLVSQRFIYMGPQVEQLLGYPASTWISFDSWKSRIHPEDRDWASGYCIAAMSQGEDHDFQYRFQTADGRTVWVRDVVSLVRENTGEVVAMRGFFIDVSEQHRQEETIRQTNAVLACESRIQSLFISDSDSGILFDTLLLEIIKITASSYGYVASLARDEEGVPCIQALAISNIAWDEETKRFYDENAPKEMRFYNFNNLHGAAIINRAPLITNDPSNHPQSGGLPPGHPPLDAFLGLPLMRGKEVIGTIGLANRPGGYHEKIVIQLQPILSACVQIMDAYQAEHERQEVLHKLEESEARLAKAQEIAHLGSWDMNVVTGEIVWSDETYRLFGKTRDEFIPSIDGFLALLHPDDRSNVKKRVELALSRQGNYCKVDYRHLRPDGSIFFFTAQGQVTWNDKGQAIRFFGTIIDITDRKKRETALAESALINRMIIHAAQVAVWDWDLVRDETVWNEKLTELFGYPAGRVEKSQQWWLDYIHPDDYKRVLNSMIAYLDSEEQSWHEEYRLKRQDGQWATVIDWGVAIKDHTGRPVRMVGAVMDISKRKQLEDELQLAKDQAEAANNAKSTFLAAMSHDIRTPMNAILGMGEVLAESSLDADQKHYIQIINRAGEGLLALINDILDLSKIEAGQLELEAIPFDVKELVKHSAEILNAKALNGGLGLFAEIDEAISGQVIGDPQRLQQILLNLLSNAIKFTNKGRVTLSLTQAAGDLLHFSVADTGVGISVERLESIFQPFMQADISISRRFGGTGLGLSICQKLVEKMEGRIWVESLKGHGSTFHFEIPFKKESVAVETFSNDDKPRDMSETSNAGLSILLADDSEENCLVIEAYLKNTPHQLTIVEDGIQALKAFKEGGIDLVLIDIQMPGMDGYQTTKAIRGWECSNKQPPTPILALTANAMKEDIEKTRQVGCNLHLSKPIGKQRLLEVLSVYSSS